MSAPWLLALLQATPEPPHAATLGGSLRTIALLAIVVAVVGLILVEFVWRNRLAQTTYRWLLLVGLLVLPAFALLGSTGSMFEEMKNVDACNSCHVMTPFVDDMALLHGRAHELVSHKGHTHTHSHRGATTWVGVAHGLAGTAPLIALLPVALSRSPWSAGAYLILFGVGTVVAMGLYALVAGVVFGRAGTRFPGLAGGMRIATALGSAALGVVWMVGAAT
jgi:hypothetical protein